MNPYTTPLAQWERDLLGLNKTLTLGIFFHDGESIAMNDVDPGSINYHTQRGVDYLVFSQHRRTVRVPNVRYWTEE